MRARIVLWMCLCLCLSAVVSHAATVVQSRLSAGTAFEASRSLAFTSNVTAGSLLVVVCSLYQSSFSVSDPTLSDTQTNAWTVRVNVGADDAGSVLDRLYMGTAQAGSSGANEVTCDPPGTAFITMVIAEISGLDPSTPVDQVASCATDGCQGSGASVSSGVTGTTAQADELVIAAMAYENPISLTITPNAPCVQLQELEDNTFSQVLNVCSDVVSSVGTQQRVWTLSAGEAYEIGAIITLKIAAATAAGTRRMVLTP